MELAKVMTLVDTNFKSPPPGEPPAELPMTSPAPIDPRLRVLFVTFRRALLMMADAIAVYCEVREKGVR